MAPLNESEAPAIHQRVARDQRQLNQSRLMARGFTLIELLVVMVIIGVLASMATLSIGVLGSDNAMEDESRRLLAIINQAKEEAELQGRDVGVFIERDGYLFMRYNGRKQLWEEIIQDDLLEHHSLPDGMIFRLWLDAREVVLKSHANSDATADEDKDATTLDNTSQKSTRVPQIALLSSGDTSPFELQLEREGTEVSWHLLVKPDNTLVAELVDETAATGSST